MKTRKRLYRLFLSMENHNQTSSTERRKKYLVVVFLGIFPIISGVLDILISLNMIEYVDTRPSRIAIFNDPHTWKVFALGATLLFFGIANILPPRMKFLGKLNICLLFVSFAAVVVGVILQKIN